MLDDAKRCGGLLWAGRPLETGGAARGLEQPAGDSSKPFPEAEKGKRKR